MLHERLRLALESGGLVLPGAGRIAVIGPSSDAVLSRLPQDRVQIIQGFFPDHRHWTEAGYDVALSPEGLYAVALVVLPRAKPLAQAWVEMAARITSGGLVVVDGQKTDGIDSMIKALKERVTIAGSVAKAHGKLVWFSGGSFTDWAAQEREIPGGFITRPGVFSADGPDKGSVALAAVLPEVLKGRVADIGAGWGFLAHAILEREGVEMLDLIEADHAALACARKNIADPRARFFWADASGFHPDAPYDVVISNPPFHKSRAGDPGLGQAFITAAAAMLKPSGAFWMVANRHLPYETTLNRFFTQVQEVTGTPGFKILHATKPRRFRR
jgi:16S rRNA (guanine1207-N2)-methyltransferase